MIELRKLLRLLVDKKGDELTLRAVEPPRMRLQGKVRPLSLPPLESFETARYAKSILPEELGAALETRDRVDFDISWEQKLRIRVAVFRDGETCSLSFRPSPEAGGVTPAS